MSSDGKKFSSGHPKETNFPGNSDVFKRYSWVIVLSAALGLATAYYLAYIHLLPVYQSSSTLLVEANAESFSGAGGRDSRTVSNSYNSISNQAIESEIQFLRSTELSQKVARQVANIKDLPNGELYPVLWSDYPEDSTEVSVETAASRIRKGISVEPVEKESDMLAVSFESYSPQEASRIVNLLLNTYEEGTGDEGRAPAKSALQFLEDKKQELRKNLEKTERRLSAFNNSENNDSDTVATEPRTVKLDTTFPELEAQKQEIQVQLATVNSGITNYENQLNAIKPGLGSRYSEDGGPRIKRYQRELADLQADRLALVSNNPQLTDDPDSESWIRQADQRINNLEGQIKRLINNILSQADESSALPADLDGNAAQEISNIRSRLIKLRVEKNQKQAQLQALNSKLNNSQAFLDQTEENPQKNEVPENQDSLGQLEEQVEIYEQFFSTVKEQASEASAWEQAESQRAGTVISYASVPDTPVKPRKLLWLIGGFLIGLFLPIGFLLMKKPANNKINSIQDLKAQDYPLLAVIYAHSILKTKKNARVTDSSNEKSEKIADELIMYHYGTSPVTESYRELASEILQTNSKNSPQTIMITSPGSGEGKTTLTANLATALTEMGKTVLIIDCDMRKSDIPKLFGIDTGPGIMEIIFRDVSAEEAINSAPIPGLDVLTPGQKKPSRPNSVIGSKSFKKLIERFKMQYDFILFDTAPYDIIGDAAPILQLTDGIILNSKFLSTTKIQLNKTIDKLERTSAQILGLVLNSYNPDKSMDENDIKGLYNKQHDDSYDYNEPETSNKKQTHDKHNYKYN